MIQSSTNTHAYIVAYSDVLHVIMFKMARNVTFLYLHVDTKTSSRKAKLYNLHYVHLVVTVFCKRIYQKINCGLSFFCSILAYLFFDFNNIPLVIKDTNYFIRMCSIFLRSKYRVVNSGCYCNNESAFNCCYRINLSCCGIKQTSLAQNHVLSAGTNYFCIIGNLFKVG